MRLDVGRLASHKGLRPSHPAADGTSS
jgi:hypothetical protein